MLKLAIIFGSIRPGRVGEAVAKWASELAQKRSDAEFDVGQCAEESTREKDVTTVLGAEGKPVLDSSPGAGPK
jgi:hypothetical protein